MQLAGCNRSIVCPITLVLAYGKSFVSLLLAPWSLLYQWMLVWRRRYASLSFQRAVTPTKLTCAEFVHTYERRTRTRHTRSRHMYTRASARLPLTAHPLYSILHPSHLSLSSSLARINERKETHGQGNTRVIRRVRGPSHRPARFVHPFSLHHPRASTQFPLTLIYLNYILRALAGGRVWVALRRTRACARGEFMRVGR